MLKGLRNRCCGLISNVQGSALADSCKSEIFNAIIVACRKDSHGVCGTRVWIFFGLWHFFGLYIYSITSSVRKSAFVNDLRACEAADLSCERTYVFQVLRHFTFTACWKAPNEIRWKRIAEDMLYHRHPGLWEKVVSWPYLCLCARLLRKASLTCAPEVPMSNSSFFLLFLPFRCLFCPPRPPTNLSAVVAEPL